jgi:DNA polymerase-1
MTDKRILLIDGSGFIFRAYHKLPPLTRPDGTPSGAVYGFTAMLLKLREELPASHAVVVFDAKGDNFRHALYPAYKAHRPPVPEDLIPQFPLVRHAATALNMPIYEQQGYEADDIIATYATQAADAGFEVCVVSSDKDLMQLLNSAITLYDPLKAAYITEAEVQAKFGVPPEQVVEVQAIMGDATDNIIGIKGIGAKGAAELITQFGSVEAMLERTHEITQKKRRELVEEQGEQLLLSKQLVTLKRDCTNLAPLDALTLPAIDAVLFAAFCAEMNFKTLARRVQEKYGAPITEVQEKKVSHSTRAALHLVQDEATLQQVIAQIMSVGMVAVDTETTSLDATQAELVGISLCCNDANAYYIPLAHVTQKAGQEGDLFTQATALQTGQLPFHATLDALRPLLTSPSLLKIGHNIKYDAHVLRRYGIELTPIEDTMLLSYALGAGLYQHGMDACAERELGITPVTYKEMVGSGKAQKCFSEVELQEACRYAAEDAEVTWKLYHTLKPQVISAGLTTLYERMERALVPVVVRMEGWGVKVDAPYLKQLSAGFATELARLEAEIYQLAGQHFTIGSPKQLGEILFESLALAKGKRSGKSGAYITDAETLEELALQGHALPEKVLEWRQLAKLKSTYTDALVKQINPHTGRVHTSYNMAATTTGRLSSNDPNLQNIPIRTQQGRQLRHAFIAEEGFTFCAADYSQIELRLLAHIADIAPLKEAFAEGVDVHAVTASQVFDVPLEAVDSELRRKAKTINFGIIYGMSAHGLAARLGIERSTAARYIDAYFTQYQGIAAYMERCKEQARAHGYVETLWGRRCYAPMIMDKNPNRRAFAERAAINAPLQGSAADIIKRAMIAVDGLLQSRAARSRLLLQVHDELVCEIAAGEEELLPLIRRTMEQVAHLSVPLLVEVGTGKNWGEAH